MSRFTGHWRQYFTFRSARLSGVERTRRYRTTALENAILTGMWFHRKTSGAVIKKHTRLTEAVLRSDYASMRQIVETGANLDEFDGHRMTPLLWAIMRGDIDAVRLLLEHGADPNVRPNPSDSPLWSAEDDWGFTEIAALLKSYGAVK